MGKMENLTPVKSKPFIDKQFVRIDFVHEKKVCSKFCKNPFTGDFWAKGWNITFCQTFFIYLLFFLFFFSDQRREETPGRILTRNGSKDAEYRKDVPFWGYKMKNWNLTPIYLENHKKIWPWIGNFQPKWWNMKLQVYHQKVLNRSRWKFNIMLGT